MDNDLGLDFRTSGRAVSTPTVEVVRELREEDLALLSLDRGVKPSLIKRLRDSHHAIARLVAQGHSGADIGALTGYSQSRVSILKGDPTFEELVSFYRGRVNEAKDSVFADGLARLQAIRDEALEVLSERLDENSDTFANGDLLDLVKAASDRTGLGPATKSTNVNVNIDLAERIASGRRRVAQLAPALAFSPALAAPEGSGLAANLLAPPGDSPA